MSSNNIQKDVIDYDDMLAEYGDEETASMMLLLLDEMLTKQQPLSNILDAILHNDFHGIEHVGHTVKGGAKYARANLMADAANDVQNAGINHDIEGAKKAFRELIIEGRKAHIYSLELTNTPKEEIDERIKITYEILEIFLNESEGEDHINIKELLAEWEDSDIVNMMLEKCLSGTFRDENFLEKLLNGLLQQDWITLERDSHSMKGRGRLLCLPKMIHTCEELQFAAKAQLEGDCYKYLINVIDESIFMERYAMIKRMEKDIPTEKWLTLNPSLLKLMENRENVDDIIPELKSIGPIDSTKQTEPEKPADTGNNDIDLDNFQFDDNFQIDTNLLQFDDNFEFNLLGGAETNDEIGLNKQENQELEEATIDESKGVSYPPPHFHENSIRTVLEPIPEEKEKEKEEKKQIKTNQGDVKSNIKLERIEQNVITPKAVEIGGKQVDHAKIEEPKKDDKDNLRINNLTKSKSRSQIELEEIKEHKEEILEHGDVPVKIASKSNIESLQTVNIPEKETSVNDYQPPDIKLSDDVVLVSSKKKKLREEHRFDDDYPFDSGLKCSIF